MAGAFGDWSQDLHQKWSLKNDTLSSEEKLKRYDHLKRAQKAVDEEQQSKHENTSKVALEKWSSFSENGNTSYLIKKKVDPLGVSYNKEFLIVPLRDGGRQVMEPAVDWA